MAMEYFCCYHDYRRKVAKLSDQEVGRLFRALLEYSESGAAPELTGRESIAFDFIAADIDKAKKAYAARCQANSENGKSGGRPKKQTVFEKADGFLETEKSQKEEKKEEEKKEKISPPKAPQGAGEAFERFWQAYPRKVGRGAAEKSWGKLRPDADLAERILAAVERDKGTGQWTRDRGQFIPYPATWLNQRRWEDDPGSPPPRPGPPRSYDIEELERMSVFDLPEELM